MRINNVLASPSFATWLEGDPMEVGSLLYAPDGRPRVTVLSIAHLSDSERMFFVTLLLNEVLAWVRSQPGTSSLRALLYMDEIFGVLPPDRKTPRRKGPMLTLLKQGPRVRDAASCSRRRTRSTSTTRASRTPAPGSLGACRPERDKMRVLEGLAGASAASGSSFEGERMQRTLSGLGRRVFLAHNVHEDAPLLFHTRWAMSYLRGPLTRSQIEMLMADRKRDRPGARADAAAQAAAGAGGVAAMPGASTAGAATVAAGAPAASAEARAAERPIVPGGVDERFLSPGESAGRPVIGYIYRPMLYARARLHFVSSPASLDEWSRGRGPGCCARDRVEPEWVCSDPAARELDLDAAPLGRSGVLRAAAAGAEGACLCRVASSPRRSSLPGAARHAVQVSRPEGGVAER